MADLTGRATREAIIGVTSPTTLGGNKSRRALASSPTGWRGSSGGQGGAYTPALRPRLSRGDEAHVPREDEAYKEGE